MAKPTNYHQPPQQSESDPAKPNRPNWLIIAIVGIVVLFLLQKVGCGPVQTHEEMQWIDK